MVLIFLFTLIIDSLTAQIDIRILSFASAHFFGYKVLGYEVIDAKSQERPPVLGRRSFSTFRIPCSWSLLGWSEWL